MSGHYFLSYSSVDAQDFAINLADALEAGPPSISVWLDKRKLRPGEDWDKQIVDAIRTCEGVLFILTNDSVEDQSVCKQELMRALDYKKPIIPIKFHPDAEMPFSLGARQYIDFTGEFEPALASLRRHIRWLSSNEGKFQILKDRLSDAERDLRRANASQKLKIESEISELTQQISNQQQIVSRSRDDATATDPKAPGPSEPEAKRQKDSLPSTKPVRGDFNLGTPVGLLTGALKAVPAIKYALGVGGIAALIAIIAGFKINFQVAVFGVIITLGLMFVLLVFSKLSASAPGAFKPLAFALAWTFGLITIVVSGLLVTSFFWQWPRSLESYIPSNKNVSPPPSLTPTISTSAPDQIPNIIANVGFIRGFWFDYPHEPDPGKRYWLQVDNNTWVERQENGKESKFVIVGRVNVFGNDGNLLINVGGDGSFEVFIPDRDSKSKTALFRFYRNGEWQNWRNLGEMNVIK